jgi:hypothetical protein
VLNEQPIFTSVINVKRTLFGSSGLIFMRDRRHAKLEEEQNNGEDKNGKK